MHAWLGADVMVRGRMCRPRPMTPGHTGACIAVLSRARSDSGRRRTATRAGKLAPLFWRNYICRETTMRSDPLERTAREIGLSLCTPWSSARVIHPFVDMYTYMHISRPARADSSPAHSTICILSPRPLYMCHEIPLARTARFLVYMRRIENTIPSCGQVETRARVYNYTCTHADEQIEPLLNFSSVRLPDDDLDRIRFKMVPTGCAAGT